MQTFFKPATGGAILLAVAALVAFTRADEEKIALDKLPKAVVEAVKARFPKAELVSAEKETEDGKIVYEVVIKDKEQRAEVTLTPEGKIVEIEKRIAAADLPKAVTAALETKYPKATYKRVEEVTKVKDDKDQPAYYEVNLVTADSKRFEVSVAADGKIIREEARKAKKSDKEK